MEKPVWVKREDGSYLTEMSMLRNGPCVHPVTNDTLSDDEMDRCLKPVMVDGAIKWWFGELLDGSRVRIFND